MVLKWGRYCPLRDVWKFVEALSESGEGGDVPQGIPPHNKLLYYLKCKPGSHWNIVGLTNLGENVLVNV